MPGPDLPVRPADPLARTIHKKASAVAGERADEPAAASFPVGFRCGFCGGRLRTDGSARAVDCVCGAVVDVPEDLWDALHPPRPRAPVTLVIGGNK